MVMEAARFVDGQLDHFLGARDHADFAPCDAIPTPNDTFDGLASLLEIDAQPPEHLSGDAFLLSEQTQQQVLSPDVVVLEALSLLLGKLHDVAGSLGEPVEAPLLVRSSVSPFPTGTSTPAGTSQPSAERSSKSLRYHLLILSLCELLSIQRASTGSLWPPRLSHRPA